LLQIHNGFNYEWCRNIRCCQVCSDKKGEINHVQANKQGEEESNELDYDEDRDRLEEDQEKKPGEQETANKV
jgi:hypothetical protein